MDHESHTVEIGRSNGRVSQVAVSRFVFVAGAVWSVDAGRGVGLAGEVVFGGVGFGVAGALSEAG